MEFQRELGSFGEESTGGEVIDSGNYQVTNQDVKQESHLMQGSSIMNKETEMTTNRMRGGNYD